MKFNNVARITAALLLSLTVCLGFTACSRDYTVGFLYVLGTRSTTTDGFGSIAEYGIDYQTGALLTLASSGQSTNGRNPVGLAISANQKNVYVINHDDSNIEALTIGSDGKLYPQAVTSLDGVYPTHIALSQDDAYMYVTFTYRKTTATANSGPGGVEVYKMGTATSDGTIAIGAAVTNAGANYFPVGVAPVSVAVGPNILNDGTRTVNSATCVTTPASCTSYVYVIDQDPTTEANLLVFNRNVGTGALTVVGSTTIGTTQSTGYLSGVTASAVAVAPRGVFVYVTDSASNQIIAYGVGTGGALAAITTGPFATGSLPNSITIDPRGSFLYVTNQNDNSVSSYTINSAGGGLSALSTATTVVEGTQPNCITIENALGIYMYVSNFISNTVSGFQLNSTTGALSKIRNSPYSTTATSPGCLAAVANASHPSALQSIQ